MTDQEALLSWLRIAWEKGQQVEELAERVQRGMPLGDAARELDAPLSQRSIQLESPHLGQLGVVCSLKDARGHTHNRFNPPPIV